MVNSKIVLGVVINNGQAQTQINNSQATVNDLALSITMLEELKQAQLKKFMDLTNKGGNKQNGRS